MTPQVRRRDGGDGVHAVPQDSGHSGSIWLPLLDAVLLLHRRETAVCDDRPVRAPDVQSDVSILVRPFPQFQPAIDEGDGARCLFCFV